MMTILNRHTNGIKKEIRRDKKWIGLKKVGGCLHGRGIEKRELGFKDPVGRSLHLRGGGGSWTPGGGQFVQKEKGKMSSGCM